MRDSPRRLPRPGLELQVRRGFSLVELLVALVLIDVGLLALTGTTMVLVRERAEVRARMAAVRAASNRLQRLGAAPCATATGSETHPELTETWRVALGANATRELTDSVTFGSAGAHSIVLRTRVPC